MAVAELTRRNLVKAATLGLAGTALAAGAGRAVADEATASPALAQGIYTSAQTTGYADVVISCTFDGGKLAAVDYEIVKSSDNDYFPAFADACASYCKAVAAAGIPQGVDVVSGASICTKAIADGVEDCWLQALGLDTFRNAPVNPQDESYDTCTTDYSALFQPIQVGSLQLRNRIVKSAGSSPWSPAEYEGFNPVALDLYGQMADSGVAMIVLTNIFRGLGIGPNDQPAEGTTLEEGIATAATLVDRIHQGGAYVAMQVSYGGPVGEPTVNTDTVETLQAYVAEVAAAAQRFQAAGGDAIEIKGATQDGLNAFLSRRKNQREDEYGPQTIESRCKFFTDMITAIKETCGQDFTVLALINAVEEYDNAPGTDPACLSIEETRQIAQTLEAAGADAIQVRVGTPGQEANCWAPDANHFAWHADGVDGFGHLFDYDIAFGGLQDGSHSGAGAFIPMAAAIKEAVSVPVGCAGYMDPRTAPDLINQAVADGKVDLVYMNRALNVDPQLPTKLQEGRRDEVMPCTRCFHCHDSIVTNRKTASTCRVSAAWQNAYLETMPEGFEPTPAETPKNVMVVGGGPAGMEAARIAAQRGHTVTLYEAQPLLGRSLSFAQGVKGGHERLEDYRAYLAHQLELTGVTVKTGTTVDADLVASVAPDTIVVATGGVRQEGRLEGTDAVQVIPFESAAGCRCGSNVVLLGASLQATDMALRLQAMGKQVALVHGGTFDDVDAQQSGWIQKYARAQLVVNGVKIYNGATINGMVDGGLSITDETGTETVVPCDTVVEGCDVVADTTLADELVAAGYEVHAVGDCTDPWNIQRAVTSANLAARAL